MTNAVVHDFTERMEWSAELSHEPAWIDFYRQVWPEMITAVRIDKYSKWQKWGVDRLIILANGNQFSVDEKIREKDYGDILLEEWSVCNYDWNTRKVISGTRPGWTCDPKKRCDFIAYAIPIKKFCYLLPFELLRLSFLRMLPQWKQLRSCKYPIAAKNNTYTTINIAIPWDILRMALCAEMQRNYKGNSLCLPLPKKEDDARTLLFEWPI